MSTLIVSLNVSIGPGKIKTSSPIIMDKTCHKMASSTIPNNLYLLLFKVYDTGFGIKDEDKGKIFSEYGEERFSKRISKRIIEENGINPADVKAVVFSTQAQGIIPVKEDGTLLYNNITWVDGRAEKQAKSIMNKVGGEKIFKMFSGTPIMGKDVLAKVIWLKEERPDIWEDTYKILDVNGYMKYMCTGKMVTEISGASSFALDLKKKEWMGVMKLVGMDMEKSYTGHGMTTLALSGDIKLTDNQHAIITGPIKLKGSEIKSIRQNGASLRDSYVIFKNEEADCTEERC